MNLAQRLIQRLDSCTIEVKFNQSEEAELIEIDDPYDDTKESTFHTLYWSGDVVEGKATIKPSKPIKHQGVRVELCGIITIRNEREEKTEFTGQSIRFDEGGGELREERELEFRFDCPKKYESYKGLNARVAYYVRVVIEKSLKNVVHKEEIWVLHTDPKHAPLAANDNETKKSYFKEKDFSKGVSMEVGVDDILHIEFKYDKKVFHLEERVLGQVTFKLASLDLQLGEVSIVRREYIGVGENQYHDSETLKKYEVMDGTPIPGEVVPIRLFLKAIPRLTPTYEMVNNAFSVKYYINLVLITGEGKRYFKQQEVIIYRKPGQGVKHRAGLSW